jgi:AraC family transcriptional regulator
MMTTTTYDRHASRISRAVALMAERLREEKTPTLDELADAAAMSKFHFHRVFRLLTGETCAEAVQRLRLAAAAQALAQPGTRVTEAAMRAGYSSGQAFAKALKDAVAVPASSLRADPERLAAVIATLSEPCRPGRQPMIRLEIASLDPLDVFVVTTQGRYPELNDTFSGLFMAAGGPENVRAILGWPLGDRTNDAEGAHLFVCGLVLKAPAADPAPDMRTEQAGGGLHLLCRHSGSFDGLLETVDALYAAALGVPGLEFRNAPPLFHYLDDPDETPEADMRTDIYLPVLLA